MFEKPMNYIILQSTFNDIRFFLVTIHFCWQKKSKRKCLNIKKIVAKKKYWSDKINLNYIYTDSNALNLCLNLALMESKVATFVRSFWLFFSPSNLKRKREKYEKRYNIYIIFTCILYPSIKIRKESNYNCVQKFSNLISIVALT